jgi:single-stranded-DNA-specific exonuclease
MKWILEEPDERAVEMLVSRAGLSPLIARLLVIRGIADHETARDFLSCDLTSLADPRIFRDMDRAVALIRAAIERKQRIVVYGDYDVDGVTASALLFLVLRSLGADVRSYIPDRMSEGYGLHTDALRMLKQEGAHLVITVDCGITSTREAVVAREIGIDLIITDHHEFCRDASSEEKNAVPALPDASAVLHPRLLREDVPEIDQERVGVLAGVGVAFKLAQALLEAKADDPRTVALIDLVTLGTIADVGRMTGENRVLVKHGLVRLSADRDRRPGVDALVRISGLEGKKITTGSVGFSLAPRINASGRLERADMAFRLLTTDSAADADELARALDDVNRERQGVEEVIREEARSACRKADSAKTGAFILASENWHPGVIGIVASRIADEFYRPTALISLQQGTGKGSARSVPGFDLYAALAACSDLLIGFGGHMFAAGFSIAPENVPLFREKLNAIALVHAGDEGFVRKMRVDAAVSFENLTPDLVRSIEQLAPFGQGNPEPRLGIRGIQVASTRVVGNNHLKLQVRNGSGTTLGAIAFNKGTAYGSSVREGARIAAVFTPRINSWNGSEAVELDVRDLRPDAMQSSAK